MLSLLRFAEGQRCGLTAPEIAHGSQNEARSAIIARMSENSTKFRCPLCNAEYLVVRIEEAATQDSTLLCLGCDGPLQDRDGKFVLKYFCTSGSKHVNNRKPKLRNEKPQHRRRRRWGS